MPPSKIYTPRQHLNTGPLGLYRAVFSEMRLSLEPGFEYFKRDFVMRYRQSWLGLAGAIAMPVFSTGVFFLLFKSGIFRVGDLGVPYVAYLFWGMAVWQFFSAVVLTVASTLRTGKSLLVSIGLPRFALVYSAALMALTDLLIRVVFLCLFMPFLGVRAPLEWAPAAFLALVPLFLLGMGLGLALAIVNGIFRDMSNLTQTALHFVMYLSPVLYPVSQLRGWLGAIGSRNPLTPIFDASRGIFFEGAFGGWSQYVPAAALCAFTFLLALRFFYVSFSKTLEVA